MRNAFVKVRIDSDLKKKVEDLFKEMGVSPSEAVRMFYKQVDVHKTIPFPVKVPNEETKKAIEETKNRQEIVECENVEDMFEKLEDYAKTNNS